MKWLIYKRGTIHPYRVDMIVRGIFKYSKKIVGQDVSTLYINKKDKLWWAWNKFDLKRAFNSILKKCQNPSSFSKHLKEFQNYYQKLEKRTKSIINLNLQNLKDQELIEKYDYLDEICIPVLGASLVDVDAIDIFLEDFLIQKLKIFLPKNISLMKILELYKNLFKTSYQTYLIQQEKEIIKLALRKNIKDKDIDNLYVKFWWTNLGWENVKPYNRNYFLKKIFNYQKKNNLNNIFTLCSLAQWRCKFLTNIVKVGIIRTWLI
jgi:hypothetical protein